MKATEVPFEVFRDAVLAAYQQGRDTRSGRFYLAGMEWIPPRTPSEDRRGCTVFIYAERGAASSQNV